MKKILVFVLVIILGVIGYIMFNNWRNRPEKFISQISATAEITAETERARESADTEKNYPGRCIETISRMVAEGRTELTFKVLSQFTVGLYFLFARETKTIMTEMSKF